MDHYPNWQVADPSRRIWRGRWWPCLQRADCAQASAGSSQRTIADTLGLDRATVVALMQACERAFVAGLRPDEREQLTSMLERLLASNRRD